MHINRKSVRSVEIETDKFTRTNAHLSVGEVRVDNMFGIGLSGFFRDYDEEFSVQFYRTLQIQLEKNALD